MRYVKETQSIDFGLIKCLERRKRRILKGIFRFLSHITGCIVVVVIRREKRVCVNEFGFKLDVNSNQRGFIEKILIK